MSNYRRWREPGASYLFTVVTWERRPFFAGALALALLRKTMAEVRAARPFTIDGAVVLPDHAHFIWTLPPGDDDFSTRWRLIKHFFTRAFRASGRVGLDPPYESRVSVGEGVRNGSRRRSGERAIWQRRFWEHLIRDERDYEAHMDYIHYNPVKHGHATCPHAWTASSFQHWVQRGVYDEDWACTCRPSGRRIVRVKSAEELPGGAGEVA